MALIFCPECKGKVSEKAESCPHCGYKFSEDETQQIKEKVQEEEKKKQRSNPVFGVLIVIFLGLGLFKLISSDNAGGNSNVIQSTESISWEEQDHSIGAWVFTTMQMKEKLKSPRSAKFPGFDKRFVQKDGTTYTITSYVDAQNSFGALIRKNFKATVREFKEDSWILISFEILD